MKPIKIMHPFLKEYSIWSSFSRETDNMPKIKYQVLTVVELPAGVVAQWLGAAADLGVVLLADGAVALATFLVVQVAAGAPHKHLSAH